MTTVELLSLTERNDIMKALAVMGNPAYRAFILHEVRKEMDLEGLSSDELYEASRVLALVAGHTPRKFT